MTGLLALFALAVAFIAHRSNTRLEQEFRKFRQQTKSELDSLKEEIRTRSIVDEESAEVSGVDEVKKSSPLPSSAVPSTSPKQREHLDQTIAATPAKAPTRPSVPEPTRYPRPPSPAKKTSSPWAALEEHLASKWLIWVGGVAIALGGAFLIIYSIELGLLGPATRLSLIGFLGLMLVGAGEWLRRRPLHRQVIKQRADYIPPALSAAGLFFLFGVIYTAHMSYGFIGAGATFAVLAVVALGAIALSLVQGPMIAALGVVGAFLTPALISTPNPSAVGLFAYLTIVFTAAQGILRFRHWWWLSPLCVVAIILWMILWFIGPHNDSDVLSVLFYFSILLLVSVFLAPKTKTTRSHGQNQKKTKLYRGAVPFLSKHILAFSFSLFAVYMFVAIDHSAPTTIGLALLSAVMVGLGRWDERFYLFPLASVLMVVVTFLAWPLEVFLRGNEVAQLSHDLLIYVGGQDFVRPVKWVSGYLWRVLAFALFFAGFGVWGMRSSARPGYWSGLGVVAPLLLLVVAYYRLVDARGDYIWGVVCLIAAMAFAVVVRGLRNRCPERDIAAYAIGVIAALALGITFVLYEAWMTAALSLLVLGIAWLHGRYSFLGFRYVAGLLAVIVIVRLVLNEHIFDYPLTTTPLLNWILYAYGMPAIAFGVAARLFRRSADDMLVQVLEGGAGAFVVALVTLQIRHWVHDGDLRADYFTLFEVSLQSAAWLTLSLAAFWREQRHKRFMFILGRKILFIAACLQIVLLQVVALNPQFARESSGTWIIIDTLFLAYLVPAVLMAFYAYMAHDRGEARLAKTAGVAALLLGFLYVSLEVRHIFHGPIFRHEPFLDGETYTLSVVWLVYACTLLLAATWAKVPLLRYASLAFLLLTVAKVFLIDMEALTGIYRALSFIGLGLSLVGIGYFYQRYIFVEGDTKNALDSAERDDASAETG